MLLRYTGLAIKINHLKILAFFVVCLSQSMNRLYPKLCIMYSGILDSPTLVEVLQAKGLQVRLLDLRQYDVRRGEANVINLVTAIFGDFDLWYEKQPTYYFLLGLTESGSQGCPVSKRLSLYSAATNTYVGVSLWSIYAHGKLFLCRTVSMRPKLGLILSVLHGVE
jgi:hypothetical protein